MVEVLLADGFPIPTNASFWVRAYQDTELRLLAGGMEIEVERIEREFSSTGGKLIELRPRQLLDPNTNYKLQLTPGGFDATFITGSELDTTPPATPQVTRSGPITNAFELCQTAGVIADVKDLGMPVIHLMEDPETGELFEAYARSNALGIPTDPNMPVDFTVVAIDIAGNRSNPTDDFAITAGAVPQVERFVGSIDEDNVFGCNCIVTRGTQAGWLLLGIAIVMIRIRRNR